MRSVLRIAAVIVFVLVALGCLPGTLREARAQAGFEVESIEFEGNKRYSAETVRQVLRTKRGDKLDRALLNEDITTLYKFFATVEVVETNTAEGVQLLFKVSENPPVTTMAFRGSTRFTETKLAESITTKRGLPLNSHDLDSDRVTLTAMFKQSGYHFVEIETTITDDGPGKSVTFVIYEGPEVTVESIIFRGPRIAEGDRTQGGGGFLGIFGGTASEEFKPLSFGRDRLMERMVTDEAGFLNISGHVFVEAVLNQDLLSVRNFYRSEGYLDAKVDLVDLVPSEDREEVTIIIGVTEGVAYTIGTIAVEGAEGFPGGADALIEQLDLATGDRRQQRNVGRAIDSLEEAYKGEGYASVVVRANEELPAAGSVVNMTFVIEERAKIYVGRIDIEGNRISQDKVIRREISLRPGDVLNDNEIRKSVTRLRALDFFPRVSVRVPEPAPGEDPSKKDVVFEVDDAGRTGRVRFAVGFSTDLGAIASFAVTKRNFDWKDWPDRFSDILSGNAFAGAGQTFSLEVAPGQNVSSYRVAFNEPWMFEKPISFGWDIYLRKFSRFDYDVDRRGGNISLGRRWIFQGKKTDTVLGLSGVTRLEKIKVSDVDRDATPTAFLAEGKNDLFSQRVSISVDSTDHPTRATRGFSVDLSSEIGLAGDIQFWRAELEAKRFWVVARDDEEREHVFSVRGKAGYVKELSGSDEADPNVLGRGYVPVYERYFAGGSSSSNAIRGFEFGGAGAHGEGDPRYSAGSTTVGRTLVKTLGNSGDPMGGNILVVSSAEYSFPLYQRILRGVLFVDAGMTRDSMDSSHGISENQVEKLTAAWARSNSTRLNRLARRIDYNDGKSFWNDFRISTGFGLRITIPAFGPQPIALDFGIAIKDQDGDEKQVFSFSIERAF
jgi:outer membrane protein insertion porin family